MRRPTDDLPWRWTNWGPRSASAAECQTTGFVGAWITKHHKVVELQFISEVALVGTHCCSGSHSSLTWGTRFHPVAATDSSWKELTSFFKLDLAWCQDALTTIHANHRSNLTFRHVPTAFIQCRTNWSEDCSSGKRSKANLTQIVWRWHLVLVAWLLSRDENTCDMWHALSLSVTIPLYFNLLFISFHSSRGYGDQWCDESDEVSEAVAKIWAAKACDGRKAGSCQNMSKLSVQLLHAHTCSKGHQRATPERPIVYEDEDNMYIYIYIYIVEVCSMYVLVGGVVRHRSRSLQFFSAPDYQLLFCMMGWNSPSCPTPTRVHHLRRRNHSKSYIHSTVNLFGLFHSIVVKLYVTLQCHRDFPK